MISGNDSTRLTTGAKFRTIDEKTNIYNNSFFSSTIPVRNQTTHTDVAQTVAQCNPTSLD